MHSKKHWSKHFPTVSHASQQCISVPKCLFLYARNAVEAVKSLALGCSMSHVRAYGQSVPEFPEYNFEVSQSSECVVRVLVTVADLFQN